MKTLSTPQTIFPKTSMFILTQIFACAKMKICKLWKEVYKVF